jgi:hypothetical protein
MGGCSLEKVVNMLRGFDEPLNDRSDGPDHCAEDCPEQYREDDVDDVEHDGGYLLWVDGWWAPVGEFRGAYERANEGPLLKSI